MGGANLSGMGSQLYHHYSYPMETVYHRRIGAIQEPPPSQHLRGKSATCDFNLVVNKSQRAEEEICIVKQKGHRHQTLAKLNPFVLHTQSMTCLHC